MSIPPIPWMLFYQPFPCCKNKAPIRLQMPVILPVTALHSTFSVLMTMQKTSLCTYGWNIRCATLPRQGIGRF